MHVAAWPGPQAVPGSPGARSRAGGRSGWACGPVACCAGHAPWVRLQPRWEACLDDSRALSQQLAHQGGMSPCWRLLLLSDGSLTRHLQLVTDAADVDVEVTAHHVLGSPNLELLPQECQSLRPPLVQRQVYLRPVATPGGGAPLSDRPAPERPLVYACSWWHEADFEASMSRVGAPIWRNLSAQRAECYRQPACLVLGDPAVVEGEGLEAAFGRKGPFWGRWYTLWRGGRVLTVIYEVFNPQLGDWAGDNDGRGLAGL